MDGDVLCHLIVEIRLAFCRGSTNGPFPLDHRMRPWVTSLQHTQHAYFHVPPPFGLSVIAEACGGFIASVNVKREMQIALTNAQVRIDSNAGVPHLAHDGSI